MSHRTFPQLCMRFVLVFMHTHTLSGQLMHLFLAGCSMFLPFYIHLKIFEVIWVVIQQLSFTQNFRGIHDMHSPLPTVTAACLHWVPKGRYGFLFSYWSFTGGQNPVFPCSDLNLEWSLAENSGRLVQLLLFQWIKLSVTFLEHVPFVLYISDTASCLWQEVVVVVVVMIIIPSCYIAVPTTWSQRRLVSVLQMEKLRNRWGKPFAQDHLQAWDRVSNRNQVSWPCYGTMLTSPC